MRSLLICFVFLSTLLFGDNIESSSNINLWLCIIILGYNIIKDKYVSAISIFIFGFIYIYFKEFLNNVPNLYSQWGIDNVNTGFMVVMLSFIGVLVGYYFRSVVKIPSNISREANTLSFTINKPKLFYRINLLLIYLIFVGNIPLIIYGFVTGRPNAFEYGIFSNISYALCVITIINLKLYYNHQYGEIKYIKLIITTLPVFVLLFATGTRFLLLYGIIALISDQLYHLNIKKLGKLSVIFLLVIVSMNFIMDFRNSGFLKGMDSYNNKGAYEIEQTFNQKIVSNFTDEGLLRNAAMITDYTNNNGFTYGKSFGFLAIFWVPRTIWEGKPTQIDHWLIRKYTAEYDNSGHSTASGFMGEIYMDFGKYITPFLMVVFGWFLSFLNYKYLHIRRKSDYASVVINGSILAWIFFMVRSVLTSSYIFIFIIAGAYILRKIFYKWNILK